VLSSELVRQESVRRYRLEGTGAPTETDTELQALAVQARTLMHADHGAVHIMDGDMQVRIAATPGVSTGRTARSTSLCQRVVAGHPGQGPLVTLDARSDPRFRDSPWVRGELGTVRYYAAVPLVGAEGRPLGTLCVWTEDGAPVTAPPSDALAAVAAAVVALLDTRRHDADVALVETSRRGTAGPAGAAGPSAGDGPSIHTVIDERGVRTLFQPIVALDTAEVVGFEALSRGPQGTDLEAPMAMIDAARSVGRLGDLDWLCRVTAMEAAAGAGLPPGLSWFLNVEPAGLHEECPAHLLAALAHARRELRIVLEVVERDLNGHVTHLLHAADQARRDMWGVALDDVGAQQSSLALLPLLVPDVIKLDMSLVQQVPGAQAAATTAAVRAYAERTSAVILAEGIETEAHEQLARALGATYGQGYRYGRPGALPATVPAPRTVVPLRQQPVPLDGTTPFEVAAASRVAERAFKRLLFHMSRHIEERCRWLNEPFVLLASFQQARFFSAAARDRYQELSASSALTVVVAAGLEPQTTPNLQVSALLPGSKMGEEWVVCVLSAGFSAAFVARDCGDTGSDGERRFDFVYTHDVDLVTALGRSFMQELVSPLDVPVVLGRSDRNNEEHAVLPRQPLRGRSRLLRRQPAAR